MNYLEQLLDGAEVAWVPLARLCDLITTGKLNANAMVDDGIYPFFTCNEQPYKINTYAFDLEALIISGNGSQVGHLNFYNGKFNAYQRTYIVSKFKKVAKITYIFHYLKFTLKSYISQNSRKGSVPYITMPMLENFPIPIPCPENPEKSLAIQAEIVRILDAFTALTAELNAELNAELTQRKKQYNHYRERLLSFEDEKNPEFRLSNYLEKLLDGAEVVWVPLGDVVSIKTGESVSKQIISNNPGVYPVINSGREPLGFIAEWNTENDPIGITTRGAGVGSVTWQEGKYFRGNLNYSVSIKSCTKMSVRYLYHLLMFMQSEIQALCTFDGIPALNAGNLKQLPIPIPCSNDPKRSLAIQAEIVRILDKFDALTNSISEGLPPIKDIQKVNFIWVFYISQDRARQKIWFWLTNGHCWLALKD